MCKTTNTPCARAGSRLGTASNAKAAATERGDRRAGQKDSPIWGLRLWRPDLVLPVGMLLDHHYTAFQIDAAGQAANSDARRPAKMAISAGGWAMGSVNDCAVARTYPACQTSS